MNVIFDGQNSLPCGEIIIDGSNSNNKAPPNDETILTRRMVFISSDPGETRTHGQWLKRPLLYQLSYRIKKMLILIIA